MKDKRFTSVLYNIKKLKENKTTNNKARVQVTLDVEKKTSSSKHT